MNYKERLAAGICNQCGKPNDRLKVLCTECALRKNAEAKKLRDNCRQQKMCACGCGQMFMPHHALVKVRPECRKTPVRRNKKRVVVKEVKPKRKVVDVEDDSNNRPKINRAVANTDWNWGAMTFSRKGSL